MAMTPFQRVKTDLKLKVLLEERWYWMRNAKGPIMHTMRKTEE